MAQGDYFPQWWNDAIPFLLINGVPIRYTYTVKTGYACIRCGAFVELSDPAAHDCPKPYEPTTLIFPDMSLKVIRGEYDGLWIEEDE